MGKKLQLRLDNWGASAFRSLPFGTYPGVPFLRDRMSGLGDASGSLGMRSTWVLVGLQASPTGSRHMCKLVYSAKYPYPPLRPWRNRVRRRDGGSQWTFFQILLERMRCLGSGSTCVDAKRRIFCIGLRENWLKPLGLVIPESSLCQPFVRAVNS